MMSRTQAAWAALQGLPDPELPSVSVCELGIVRDVLDHGGERIEVVLTPTYSGCPATEFIEDGVRETLAAAGLGAVTVTRRLAPAWTSDWITADGRAKLHAAGVVPPGEAAQAQVIRLRPRNLPCPRCGSTHTERLSAFGSTACKALHRCLDCREPFEHFKPI